MTPLVDDFSELMGNISEFDQAKVAESDKDGLIDVTLIPLRDLIIFPNMVTPLFVGRSRSLDAISATQQKHETIICAAQIDPDVEDPKPEDIFKIGVEVALGRMLRMPDGTSSVLVQGRRRVEIVEYVQTEPFFRVKAKVIEETTHDTDEIEARRRAVLA